MKDVETLLSLKKNIALPLDKLEHTRAYVDMS